MTKLHDIYARIESDLISASAQGQAALHSEIFKKFAMLIEDEDDIEAILDGIHELTLPRKTAAPGGWGAPQQAAPMISPGIGQALSLGATLAGPVMAIAKFIASRGDKENALRQLQQAAPQLFAQNPQRAAAIFEAIYSTAPNLAKNPMIMIDLMKQMMSMPSIDLGTIARLSEIAKNTAPRGPGAMENMIGSTAQAMQGLGGMKRAGVKAAFKNSKGQSTIFNWATPACKTAGLTDAFTGSGTTMDQANQATQMNQMEQGNTFLPLDNIVHELLMKEMELSQREQVLMQQEQQLQQAMQAVQQMGSAYQNQTGVDPNTGEPAAQPPVDEPAEEAPAEEAAPPAEEAPAEEAAPPAEGQPVDESQMATPEMLGAEDPAAAAGSEEVPLQEGEMPPAEGEAPPAEDPAFPAYVPPADGNAAVPPTEEVPGAAPVEGTPEAAPADSEDEGGEGEGEDKEEGEGESEEEGQDAGGDNGQGYFQASAPQAPMIDNAAPVPGAEGEEEEEGTPTDEGGAPPAEGDVADDEGEGGPAGDADGLEGEGEEPVVEGEEGGEVEGEDKPEDEHDMELANALESEGPNTAESVEGTPEDAAHDAINGAAEGTPEDEVADQELAATLNAGGQVAGQPDVPPAMPTPSTNQMPPIGGNDMSIKDNNGIPQGSVQQPAGGGHEIVLPLRITVKIGEANERLAAESDIRNLINSLKD